MNYNKQIGNLGEDLAIKFLINDSFKILCRNFRNRFGEIDIIATKKDLLIFVEVKSRYNKSFGPPSSAITTKKKKHISTLSKYFINKYSLTSYYISYDVIEVIFNPNDDSYKINHIKNAFYPH